MKIKTIKNLRSGFKCKFHKRGSGTMRMIRSIITLEMALASHHSQTFRQWPGKLESLAFAIGVHRNIIEMIPKSNQEIGRAAIVHRMTRIFRLWTLKIRA